jgi:transposase InsO family protein
MSRRGNPYDNAKGGGLLKTLEALYCNGVQEFRKRRHPSPHLQAVYCRWRLHSSLGDMGADHFQDQHGQPTVNSLLPTCPAPKAHSNAKRYRAP